MFRIRSLADIHTADIPPPLRRLVERRFRVYLDELSKLGAGYDPATDGEFAILEPGEERRPLEAIGAPLRDAPLEGVEYDRAARCFVAVAVADNSWALSVFVPDAPGLDPRVRAWLASQTGEVV